MHGGDNLSKVGLNEAKGGKTITYIEVRYGTNRLKTGL